MTHVYVIHIIGQPLTMVRSWSDARAAIHGVKNSYCKKFKSEEDAQTYIAASTLLDNTEQGSSTTGNDVIYTDGAARDQIAVYALYFDGDDDPRNHYGILPSMCNPTAPAAELWAVLQALRIASKNSTIFSDSSYAVNIANNANSMEWTANHEMINEVHKLVRWKQTAVQKVPAHQGVPGNEMANAMCTFALNQYGSKCVESKPCS